MKTETLHYAQVLAFWFIALQLLALNIILIVYGVELTEYLPKLLRILERGL